MSAARETRLPRRTVRLLGWMLAMYGLVGLVLVGAALIALGPLLTRASIAADPAGDSLAAAATALDHSATAFDGFGRSLDGAKTSSAHASQLLKNASATSAQLADAMAVNIFGAQPLLSIAHSFRRNTDELRGVSEDVSTMSDAAASTDGPRVEPALRVLVYGLAIWLGLLATASFVAGAVLIRL